MCVSRLSIDASRGQEPGRRTALAQCKESNDEMDLFITQQGKEGASFSFGIRHSDFMLPIREDQFIQ